MKQEVFTDKRLLGALDYIDERFIAEVTESYTFEAPGEYKRDKKTVFRAYRQFTVLAACLLVLSAAFPVLNYAVQRFGIGTWEGNAGAGTEELEVPTQQETQALETEDEIAETEVIDFDKALERYANMSAEEIYADVLKGGWIVQDSDSSPLFDAGEDFWQEFLLSVENKKTTTVLFADFTASDIQVKLSEICYDGETFTITRQRRDQTSVLETETKEFKYLLSSNRIGYMYYFANNPDAYPIMIDSDGVFLYDLEADFVIILYD